jgi:hypothetical protein
MQIPAAKIFEKPEAGPHYGVLVDVVDLGLVTSVFNGQSKTYPAIRYIWVLATLGKDGKPLQQRSRRLNASSWHEKGNLYKETKMILGSAPLPTLDPESLIGQVRQLFITREISPDGSTDYSNIMGILPAPAGYVLPIPADYIRVKFRPKQQAGPQGQPVQTYAQPPQQAQPQQQYAQNPQQPAPVTYNAVPAQYQPVPAPQGADIKF